MSAPLPVMPRIEPRTIVVATRNLADDIAAIGDVRIAEQRTVFGQKRWTASTTICRRRLVGIGATVAEAVRALRASVDAWDSDLSPLLEESIAAVRGAR